MRWGLFWIGNVCISAVADTWVVFHQSDMFKALIGVIVAGIVLIVLTRKRSGY